MPAYNLPEGVMEEEEREVLDIRGGVSWEYAPAYWLNDSEWATVLLHRTPDPCPFCGSIRLEPHVGNCYEGNKLWDEYFCQDCGEAVVWVVWFDGSPPTWDINHLNPMIERSLI